jgi:hypothetical protein
MLTQDRNYWTFDLNVALGVRTMIKTIIIMFSLGLMTTFSMAHARQCTDEMKEKISSSSDLLNSDICSAVIVCNNNPLYHNANRGPFRCDSDSLGFGVGALDFQAEDDSFQVETYAKLTDSFDGGSLLQWTFFATDKGEGLKVSLNFRGQFSLSSSGIWLGSLNTPNSISFASEFHKVVIYVANHNQFWEFISVSVDGNEIGAFSLPVEYWKSKGPQKWIMTVGNYGTYVRSVRYLP